jgi:8-oxo-dGTP pyrophosphatase MutT (NUDIX family)
MHRRPLLDSIAAYEARHPEEGACVQRIRALVEGHEDCFSRSCAPGHITASAWILSHDRESFLLTHHRKLRRWLQLGGHADGDPDVRSVALREAREESGMDAFEFLQDDPIDLDVHVIPARKTEPRHEHHDIRFLLVASEEQTLRISDESLDLRWFPCSSHAEVLDDESTLRLARKARAVAAPP